MNVFLSKKSKLVLFFIPILLLNQCQLFQKKNKLVVGVVNAVDSLKYTREYPKFVKYIADELNFDEYELKVLNYQEIAAKVYTNDIDIAIFSPYSYLEGKKKFPELNVFAVSITEDKKGNLEDGYHSVIAVNKDSDIYNMSDLENKTLLFTHTKSTSGYKIPSSFFNEKENINIRYIDKGFSGGHKKSLVKLKNKKIDAIATYEEVFFELKDELKINPNEDFRFIYRSEIIPNNAYVLSPKLDTDLQDKIKLIFYNSIKDSVARKTIFKNNAFEIRYWAKKKDYFYNELRKRLGSSNAKPKYSLNVKIKSLFDDYIEEKYPNFIKDLQKTVDSILVESGRFYFKDINENNIFNDVVHEVSLELDLLNDKTFAYHFYIDNIYHKVIENEYKSVELLKNDFPYYIADLILKGLDFKIKRELFLDPKQDYWLIKYGTKDGINIRDYDFVIVLKSGKKIPIKIEDFSKDCDKDPNLLVLPAKYNNDYLNVDYIEVNYRIKHKI